MRYQQRWFFFLHGVTDIAHDDESGIRQIFVQAFADRQRHDFIFPAPDNQGGNGEAGIVFRKFL